MDFEALAVRFADELNPHSHERLILEALETVTKNRAHELVEKLEGARDEKKILSFTSTNSKLYGLAVVLAPELLASLDDFFKDGRHGEPPIVGSHVSIHPGLRKTELTAPGWAGSRARSEAPEPLLNDFSAWKVKVWVEPGKLDDQVIDSRKRTRRELGHGTDDSRVGALRKRFVKLARRRAFEHRHVFIARLLLGFPSFVELGTELINAPLKLENRISVSV
ncbi:MAG: hypothetical protein AB7G54_00445 [Methyloceanibacter sp.]